MTQVDAGLLALVERAMEEWENDQEAPSTESCAQHIVAALRAPSPEARVRDLDWWIAFIDKNSGGYNPFRQRLATAIAALSSPPPTAGRESIARVIDPELFEKYDLEFKSGRLAQNGRNWADVCYGEKREAVFAKADAILRLAPSLSTEPVAEPFIWLNAYADAHLQLAALKKAAGKLVDMARTSGGTAGRDEGLCSACEAVEQLLAKAKPLPPVPAASPSVSDASLSFICPKCGTRGITDGNASTVSEASREALEKAYATNIVYHIDNWTGATIKRGFASSWHYGELWELIKPAIIAALAKSFDNTERHKRASMGSQDYADNTGAKES